MTLWKAIGLPLINIVFIMVIAVIWAALLTWVERRMLGFWQERYGPNRVGPSGVFQVVADFIKLLMKEDFTPRYGDRFVFVIAPASLVIAVLMPFGILPIAKHIGVSSDLNIGILFFLAMSSLTVYSVVLGGWASNNKYSLLGSLRGASQMLSYEVFMGLALMGVVLITGTFNLRKIVEAQSTGMLYVLPQFFGFVIFFIAGLAETRRLPYDLPEGEQELVAGYHTEYSSMKFALYFLGEYLGVILISALITTLYFGGWRGPFLPGWLWFMIKTIFFMLTFILLRAALPRPRYDQLTAFGWKVMLPLALLNFLVTGAVVLILMPQGGS
ncbi:MAG TPA: NADH-quinone oxidoreductase subunit NuoH [Gammaproteobacteria bacterium]|nr:NADH-quinone oxidoreductase subunit NuoH [Gammaproteobacteria bacterium]